MKDMTNHVKKTTKHDKAIRKDGFFCYTYRLKKCKEKIGGKGDIPLSLGCNPKETSLSER